MVEANSHLQTKIDEGYNFLVSAQETRSTVKFLTELLAFDLSNLSALYDTMQPQAVVQALRQYPRLAALRMLAIRLNEAKGGREVALMAKQTNFYRLLNVLRNVQPPSNCQNVEAFYDTVSIVCEKLDELTRTPVEA